MEGPRGLSIGAAINIFLFLLFFSLSFYKKIICLFERDCTRGRGGRREADSPLSREPDVGLDPRASGS